MSSVAYCPECNARVNVGSKPREGQTIVCARCHAELEVISVDPLELDWAFTEVADDWEEYDLDDDDDEEEWDWEDEDWDDEEEEE